MDTIVLKNICKSYEGNPVLENVSLTIEKGKMTAIMGKSGVGKTTLLRILMNLEKADSGSISGMDKLRIGSVFQEDRLCNKLSSYANIKIASSFSRDIIMSYISRVCLYNYEHVEVSKLSGGMRSRVCILRALLSKWDILFLDEPFKCLDIETKKRVIDVMEEFCKVKTVVLVTHDIEEVEMMGIKNIINL